MKKFRLPFVFAAAFLMLQSVFFFVTHPPAAAAPVCDRYVMASHGVDVGACNFEGSPCKTIQYAIDQASMNDVVCVAKDALVGPLTYSENLSVTKSLVLEGAWEATCGVPVPNCKFAKLTCNAADVTIDGGHSGRVIGIEGEIKPTIDCFTITGGDAAGLGGDPGGAVDNDAGGGIFSRKASPIITNNVISANYGCQACPAAYGRGGGIYLIGASDSALIQGNVIANNVADDGTWGQGGGLMLRDSYAHVLTNTIYQNRAGFSAGYGGGAAIIDGAPTFAGNTIALNVAGQSVQGLGGGVFIWSSGPVLFKDNTLQYNQAINNIGSADLVSRGGGLFYDGYGTGAPQLLDNEICDNIASPLAPQVGQGGGMYLTGLGPGALLSGNLLEANIAGHNFDGEGGGIYLASSQATLWKNTFSGNSATWAGTHGEGGGLFVSGGAPSVRENTIKANYGAGFPGLPSTASGHGGGAALDGSSAVLENNQIHLNGGTNAQAYGMGGGVYTEGGAPTLSGNTIAENYATVYQTGFGGGVAISGSLSLLQFNQVVDNSAALYDVSMSGSGEFGAGGGVYIYQGVNDLIGNHLLRNIAAETNYGFGGGAYTEGATLVLDRNTIVDNNASPGNNSYGGGLRFTLSSNFTMTNNIVGHNMASTNGSGVTAIASVTGLLAHNTIAENYGGDGSGVFVDTNSQLNLQNTIVVSQSVGILNDEPLVSSVIASETLYENNAIDYSAGVISSNEFPGPAALDSAYRLTPGSNAIDKGVTLVWIDRDIDWDPRPVGLGVDLGADEWSLNVFLSLIFNLFPPP